MKCLNLNFLGFVACFIEFLQDKNTTEHPHKLSSQIVKERSQLLSWEAGILPTFKTLSTSILQNFHQPQRLLLILSKRQISNKFTYLAPLSLPLQRAVLPKKLRIIRTAFARARKIFTNDK
jgi:hypothetical protein